MIIYLNNNNCQCFIVFCTMLIFNKEKCTKCNDLLSTYPHKCDIIDENERAPTARNDKYQTTNDI